MATFRFSYMYWVYNSMISFRVSLVKCAQNDIMWSMCYKAMCAKTYDNYAYYSAPTCDLGCFLLANLANRK